MPAVSQDPPRPATAPPTTPPASGQAGDPLASTAPALRVRELPDPPRRAMRTLVALHVLLGVMLLITVVASLPPAIFGVLEVFAMMEQEGAFDGAPPELREAYERIAWVAIAGVGLLTTLHGAIVLWEAWVIDRLKARITTIVISIGNLTLIPLGTIAGIMALVMLLKPEVVAAYRAARQARRAGRES